MKIKYSKKIDPKNTKPTNDEALVNFNNKLNDLANTIQSENLTLIVFILQSSLYIQPLKVRFAKQNKVQMVQ